MRLSLSLVVSLFATVVAVDTDSFLAVPIKDDRMLRMTTVNDDPPHYGDPKTGCRKDEQSFRIEGVSGDICAPKCAFGQCPGDVPDGVSAEPVCALGTPQGDKYCALLCNPNASDNQCGPATCQPIQGRGICTYDM